MSRYVDYEHGKWVQSEMEAHKVRKPTKRESEAGADRTGWYGAPAQLNEFHHRAFNILGIVAGGIYNAPISWNAVRWSQPKMIIVPWKYGKGFGTWDFNELTMFTFLCHVARIRGYIAPCNRDHLHVFLSERTDKGGMAERHPSLQQAIDDFEDWFPHDHEIRFPADRPNEFILPQIRRAVTAYHHALDMRQHATVAAHSLVDSVQRILNMPWKQGATLCADGQTADSKNVETATAKS